MQYDLFVSFYTKESDSEPRYRCPLGFECQNDFNHYSSLGFIEKQEPGYVDYYKDVDEYELPDYAQKGYVSEVMDVLYSGEVFEKIQIEALEFDMITDKGIPPRGFMIGETFVEFNWTEPLASVWFIKCDPNDESPSDPRFRVPMKKLKDYFEVLTQFEVIERMKNTLQDANYWTFERLKDYCESGIDDAVDLASRTFFGRTDIDGNPEILHALAVGMAGKTKNEMIVGFLHDVVEDSDLECYDLRVYGFSDEVVDAVAILTHDKTRMSYDDYIAKIGFSNNNLAINVKINDLKHNIERGKVGHHRKLVKKHEEALTALLDYKKGKAHLIRNK